MATTNYLGTLAQLAAAASTANANRKYQKQQQGLQDRIDQTYNDPNSVYQSQFRATDENFYKDMKAQAAARGRTTDAYKMGLAREAQFQNFLGQQRNQLQSQMGANAQMQPTNQLFGQYTPYLYALGSMLGTQKNKDGTESQNPFLEKANQYVDSGVTSALGYMKDMFSAPAAGSAVQQYSQDSYSGMPSWMTGGGADGSTGNNWWENLGGMFKDGGGSTNSTSGSSGSNWFSNMFGGGS
jgi:hypothetical protein